MVFWGNKSYLRYLYPLPIQRTSEDSPFINSNTYKKVKNQILNYDGTFITIDDDWFYSESPHKDIADFIASNYYTDKSINMFYIQLSTEFYDPNQCSLKKFHTLRRKQHN